ncbi:hypothetical protein [Paenibacillus hamazuiensis]|uniref:hypothetical protein n=1 Tax=Paenibacillus hamazuiensis TaxID=2936508 RepID=UPI00200FCD3E|nr:hypothetical protein [Paenibacillus hamazuiensis]
MELSMTMDEVLHQVVRLQGSGESLNKKHIKKNYPDLMKNALYYYPSWDHVLHKAGVVH